jgi:hypothetical protein
MFDFAFGMYVTAAVAAIAALCVDSGSTLNRYLDRINRCLLFGLVSSEEFPCYAVSVASQ